MPPRDPGQDEPPRAPDRRIAACALVLWVWTILPLSIDAASVQFGGYDVRAVYATYAGASALLVWTWLRREPAARAAVAQWVASRAPWAFGAMALAGAASLPHSAHVSRSALYLAWTIGTLTAVPVVTDFLVRTLRPWAPRVLALYVTAQSAVVAYCAAAATDAVRLGGRAYVWRHRVWYQEPSYFAAFALVAGASLRVAAARDPDPRWRGFLLSAYAGAIVAAALSTSRAGLFGALLLAGVEGVALARRIRAGGPHPFTPRTISLGVTALLVLLLLTDLRGARWAMSTFLEPRRDGSFRERIETLRAQARVFALDAWTGAGPGASGARLVEDFPDDRLLHLRYGSDPAAVATQRDAPLALSVWTEIPTEWGILGAAAFATGLVLCLRGLRGAELAVTLTSLGVAWAACQTLPRFDLWLSLAVVRSLAARPPPDR